MITRLSPALIANRVLVALFGMLLLFVSGIAVYEILFAVPLCANGLADCPVRSAHFAGSRLAAAAILGVWIYWLLWLIATRRQERRGKLAALPLFWTLPALVAVQAAAILT